jgi:hypothetical protein
VLFQPLGLVQGIAHAKRPQRLPVVLSAGEVGALFAQLGEPWRLMTSLLYGSGLRLMECVTLRVKDIDLEQRQLYVRHGKGAKDRVALLPESLLANLRTHLAAVKAQHLQDLERGAGNVELPHALRLKYPNAPREWVWQWVFPATRTYLEPVTGEGRRHHIHETALQRAVRRAVQEAGISKPVSCHALQLFGRHDRHPELGANPWEKRVAGVRHPQARRRRQGEGCFDSSDLSERSKLTVFLAKGLPRNNLCPEGVDAPSQQGARSRAYWSI